MGKIWATIVTFSIIYGLVTGRVNDISNVILSIPEESLYLVFSLIASTCFWTGMMYVMEDVGIITWLSKALRPLMKLLFPRLHDEKAIGYLSTNIAANMFGLGFAATPSGLKGFKRLQEVSTLPKDVASDEMITFLILNTSGVTLIPTTVIAIRKTLGSTNPADFIFIGIIATVVSSAMGLIGERLLRRKYRG